MKLGEAIELVDRLRPNTYDRKDKIRWLSQLDMRVKTLVIDTHEGGDAVTFNGYNENTDLETVLLVPAPFEEVYERWLTAQIEYYDMQEDRYNNAMDLFNTVWEAFRCWYNRTHCPKGRNFKF